MKFLHTSDLHIGKRVNGFSMLPDQKYILDQILAVTEQEKPEAVLIAGDIYDKAQPSAEAVRLLDEFLTQLAAKAPAVFIISGNHDSPERVDFGSRLMRERGLYIAGLFEGRMQRVQLEDAYGVVNIWMLPYVKPAVVSPWLEEPANSYDDAVRRVIGGTAMDVSERNVLAAHQFVTAMGVEPERSESEAIFIGGLDNVDVSAFDNFDYVALGHLHGPQRVGRDTVRYAGSPLKYSFSEVRQKKSVTIVELEDKGTVKQRQIPLNPLRDMRCVKGPIDELIAAEADRAAAVEETQIRWNFSAASEETESSIAEWEDYVSVTLTDKEEPYDAIGRLRAVYPNMMCLDFDRGERMDEQGSLDGTDGAENIREKDPAELFSSFYLSQNGDEMNVEQDELMRVILRGAAERAARSGGDRL